MKIQELVADKAFTFSEHNNPFVNPYNGCTEGCPFCYRLSTPEWEDKIDVYTNIAELLDERLCDWNCSEHIFMGNICDPYMPIEKTYGLTRRCIEVINKHGVPLVITTKSDHDIVFRDVDLFTASDVTVVIELAQIKQLKNANSDDGQNYNIVVANRLKDLGVKVYTTIAPFLPHITDIEQTINLLHSDIPIYLDGLNVNRGSVQANRMKQYIAEDYPDLLSLYENLLENEVNDFEHQLTEYKNHKQVKFMPFELS